MDGTGGQGQLLQHGKGGSTTNTPSNTEMEWNDMARHHSHGMPRARKKWRSPDRPGRHQHDGIVVEDEQNIMANSAFNVNVPGGYSVGPGGSPPGYGSNSNSNSNSNF